MIMTAKYGFAVLGIFLFYGGERMDFGIGFFITSIMLGVGLAMDAFSVSLANGLNEPCMKKRKMSAIAGMFAFFQALMPMIGWICVHTIVQYFQSFEKFIPWIALVLLAYIGTKMLLEGIRCRAADSCPLVRLTLGALLVQGVATSIDALSVGFTIAEYNAFESLLACAIIGALTFAICLGGIFVGKKAGGKLAGKSGYFGGAILIFIGFEIFITSFF